MDGKKVSLRQGIAGAETRQLFFYIYIIVCKYNNNSKFV